MKKKEIIELQMGELVAELQQCEIENNIEPIEDIVFGSDPILGLRNIEDDYDGVLISYKNNIKLLSYIQLTSI